MIAGTFCRFIGGSAGLAALIDIGSDCELSPTELRARTLNEYISSGVSATFVV